MTIEEIQAELQEEIDLCNKYFIEEDMHKESTEHERLALKIVTMCMQTLSALKDGALEDYKHVKQWKSDVMEEFCRYDVSSFEELVANARNKAIDDFVEKISLEISESLIWGMLVDWFKHEYMNDTSDKIVDYVIDTVKETAEQLKGRE